MDKLDFSKVELAFLATHRIGNAGLEESLDLSIDLTEISEETTEYLKTYFFNSIKSEEVHQFHHPVEIGLNPAFGITQDIFTDRASFMQDSQNLAKLLYEESDHPNILDGNLNVVFLQDILYGDEHVSGLGIFKSESQSAFLQMKQGAEKYEIKHGFGYDLKGLDKGCLVLNTEAEDGYDVFVFDKKSKGEEAVYWKSNFLGVREMKNEFYQTGAAMAMTRNFLDSPITAELELDSTDKVDLLHKSKEYFKKNDHFHKGSFEEAVFSDEQLIEGFRGFEEKYANEHNVSIPVNFEISEPAVRRNSKFFKSVLKLDKNFSIYCHGDKTKMDRGSDEEGKFYKFYYDVEN